jgi:hypothetical protein
MNRRPLVRTLLKSLPVSLACIAVIAITASIVRAGGGAPKGVSAAPVAATSLAATPLASASLASAPTAPAVPVLDLGPRSVAQALPVASFTGMHEVIVAPLPPALVSGLPMLAAMWATRQWRRLRRGY